MDLENNRRAFPRNPIDLPACFKLVGMASCDCVIEDFCFGGLYISYKASVASQLSLVDSKRRMPITLTFSVSNNCHQLKSFIIRKTESGMGLYVENMPKDVFEAFQNHSKQKLNSPQTTKNGSLNKARYKRIKSDLHQCLLKGITPITEEFFAELTNHLWKTYESMPPSRDRRDLQDSIVVLENNKMQIAHTYLDLINTKLTKFLNSGEYGSPEQAETKLDNQELSMINHDDFDIWLSVKVCAQRLDALLKDELYLFKERLVTIFGNINPKSPLLPIGLVVIFKEAMDGYLDQKKPRELIFACYTRQYSNRILDVYKAMNACLDSNGMEINEKQMRKEKVKKQLAQNQVPRRARSTAAGQTVRPEQPDSVATAPTPQGEYIPGAELVQQPQSDDGSEKILKSAKSAHPFAVSKRLIQELKEGAQIPGAEETQGDSKSGSINVGAVPLLSTQDIHQSISQIQLKQLDQLLKSLESNSLENEELAPISMSDHLNELSHMYPDKNLELESKESAKIIDYVFDHLVGHDMLNIPVRQLLNQLRIPYYRVFLDDPELFDSNENSAKGVLDAFAKLGIKGLDWDRKCKDTMLSSAKKIIGSESLEQSLFDEVMSELSPIIEKNEEAYLKNVVRLLEGFKGRETLNSARKVIDQFLSQFLKENKLPFWLDGLLNAGWYKLLELSYIRRGSGSREYQMAKTVISELNSRIVHQKINAEFDEYRLLALVKDGINQIVSKRVNHQKCIEHIQDMLFTKDNYIILSEMVTPEFVKKNAQAGKLRRDEQFGEKKQILRKLKVGDWVEFPGHAELTQKTRLAAISEDRDHFLFVNYQGVRALECSDIEILKLVKDGMVKVVESAELPLVEQGLNHYVDNIYHRIRTGSLMDTLTGLPDRLDLENRIKTAIGEFHSANVVYSAIYFNLDAFGMINKACGYQAGDVCIKRIALELKFYLKLDQKSKQRDAEKVDVQVLSRVTGNTFCYIAPMNADQAFKAADGILQKINEFRFKWEDNEYELQASVGIYTFVKETLSPETVLDFAASSMMEAKSQGGNKIHVYDSDKGKENIKDKEIYTWVANIEQAIKEKRLYLRGQPIIPMDNDDHRPYYEILLGLVSDSGKRIPLSDYIEAAERHNRISRVDQWVVSRAMAWVKRKLLDDTDIAGVNINLSGSSLNDFEFMNFLFGVLKEYKGPPGMFNFEITETSAIKNLDNVSDFITEMRDLGCCFWLDDFGSGMSSYVYLKELPIDFIKIDGTFIRHLKQDVRDVAIVRSILDIGRAMGVKVVAESVENEETMAVLRELGVDYVQGYLVGKDIILDV